MQIDQNKLIDELLTITEKAIVDIRKFKDLTHAELNVRKSDSAWNILECMEHLNLYGDFYLPEIEKRLLQNQIAKNNTIFNSGWLGNYFANLMKVENGSIKKMKTPGDKNPVNTELSVTVIDRQLKQLDTLKSLLHQCRKADLTEIKASISLSKWIKLRLGDTLRFLIYHIDRHVQQASRNMPK